MYKKKVVIAIAVLSWIPSIQAVSECVPATLTTVALATGGLSFIPAFILGLYARGAAMDYYCDHDSSYTDLSWQVCDCGSAENCMHDVHCNDFSSSCCRALCTNPQTGVSIGADVRMDYGPEFWKFGGPALGCICYMFVAFTVLVPGFHVWHRRLLDRELQP